MRIVLIDKEEGYKIGGLIVYTQRLSNYLTSKGHKVYILRYAKKESKDIVRLPYYLAESRSFIFLPTEKTLDTIRKNIKKIEPDIVYTTIGLSPLDFLIPSVCQKSKTPIAGVWHADFNYSLSSFQILAKSLFLAYLPFVKQLYLLHVFSQKLADFYITHGVAKKRILVLPNGIDQKFYTTGRSEFATRFSIKKGILFLGRLTLQKNPEVLIKSFLALDPHNNTKLVLVGHGDLEEKLRGKYKDPRIIFTGVITDEKRKRDIIRACQISVLPSRAEGMPLALLEAMSCGLACIASDAGSNSELLKDAGIVIPSTRMQQELPAVLRMCLDFPEFISLLGKKAQQKVISEYSQETIFNRLTASFEKTIYDYQQRGFPQSKPIKIDETIGRKLITILKKLENLINIDLTF